MLLIGALAVSAFAGSAQAEQYVIQNRNGQILERRIPDAQVHNNRARVVVKTQNQGPQRRAVGHRFAQRDIVIVKDWQRRGLRQPGRDEVYATNGDALYLLAASSLIVKALMN